MIGVDGAERPNADAGNNAGPKGSFPWRRKTLGHVDRPPFATKEPMLTLQEDPMTMNLKPILDICSITTPSRRHSSAAARKLSVVRSIASNPTRLYVVDPVLYHATTKPRYDPANPASPVPPPSSTSTPGYNSSTTGGTIIPTTSGCGHGLFQCSVCTVPSVPTASPAAPPGIHGDGADDSVYSRQRLETICSLPDRSGCNVSVCSDESSFLVDHAMNLIDPESDLLTSLNAPQSSHNLPAAQSVNPCITTAQQEVLDLLRRKQSDMSRRRISDPLTGDLTFKQQFLSMFQPSTDNKLALKLFGSVTAVTKERERIAGSKHWIIHPASNFRFYFDLFMLVVLLANLMILPVSIAFFNADFSLPWIIFNCFSDTIFIIDLVCNFRTGLINPENSAVVVLDPKEIASRYIRSWFFVDLISSIPFDYVVLVISIWDDGFARSQIVHAGRALRILRMAKLLSLIKLLRLSRLVRYVSQFEEIYFLNIAGVFVRIFNFMCLMMLMAHWSGCIQFLVPMLQGFPRDSWVVINELEHAPWFEQYTWSFFKAISHQLSIGYGRYPPQSVSDAWLTVLSMLTGAFTYALFIGHASNLIHSLDASRRQYREKWKQVEEYMAYRKLPRQLRAKISDFYEHRFQGKIFDEDAILGELNDPLRELIINYNCRDLVSSVPFFSHADPNFVTAVITRLNYEFFLPNDVIVREGTLGDKMYFIQEGLVEIYLEPKLIDDAPTIITCLSDGSYFGEICLLTKAKRVASVRAVSCCSLFSLQSDNFNCVLNEYPLMRTALESVAAERLNKIGRDPSIVTQRSRENLRDALLLGDDSHSTISRAPSPFPFQYPYSFPDTHRDPDSEPGDVLLPHSPFHLSGAEALGSRLLASTQQYRTGAPPPPSPRTGMSPSSSTSHFIGLHPNSYTNSKGNHFPPAVSPTPYPRNPERDRFVYIPDRRGSGIQMRPIQETDSPSTASLTRKMHGSPPGSEMILSNVPAPKIPISESRLLTNSQPLEMDVRIDFVGNKTALLGDS